MEPCCRIQRRKCRFCPDKSPCWKCLERQSAYVAFASAPEDEEYEFPVKYSDYEASISYALFQAGTAAEITLNQIVGKGFAVENYQTHDLVFVAMGTGLAPLRATLRAYFSAAQ
ncbi:MAG: hypothetical protein U0Y68_11245 [Blastocatellia bacterium]